MKTLDALSHLWPFLVVGAPGAFALYKTIAEKRRQDRKDKSDLIEIAQDAAGALISHHRAEIERLHKRVDELESEIRTLEKDSSKRLAEKDAELAILRGKLRSAEALITAQRNVLEANGWPLPNMVEAIWYPHETEAELVVDPRLE